MLNLESTLIEIKNCEDARPEQQLQAAHAQHAMPVVALDAALQETTPHVTL